MIHYDLFLEKLFQSHDLAALAAVDGQALKRQ